MARSYLSLVMLFFTNICNAFPCYYGTRGLMHIISADCEWEYQRAPLLSLNLSTDAYSVPYRDLYLGEGDTYFYQGFSHLSITYTPSRFYEIFGLLRHTDIVIGKVFPAAGGFGDASLGIKCNFFIGEVFRAGVYESFNIPVSRSPFCNDQYSNEFLLLGTWDLSQSDAATPLRIHINLGFRTAEKRLFMGGIGGSLSAALFTYFVEVKSKSEEDLKKVPITVTNGLRFHPSDIFSFDIAVLFGNDYEYTKTSWPIRPDWLEGEALSKPQFRIMVGVSVITPVLQKRLSQWWL